MRVLVIGSGAREHAIIKSLYRSPLNPQLFCYGVSINPGIRDFTTDYKAGDITDCRAVLDIAKQWGIELAIIGPEAPLEKGLADALWLANIATIGPKKELAQIETSKEFARDLMKKYHISGLPRYGKFNTLDNKVDEFLKELGDGHYVIKANGLMGGKGVKVAGEHVHSHAEAIAFCQEIFEKKQTVIIEEKLVGQEFSFMCFADGQHLIPMPLVQDHKRAYNDDKGPNTGGMGSYSDANHSLPFLMDTEVEEAFTINQAVYKALSCEVREKYIGILYGSFIATKRGVFVIEFNARFGDPEALNILSILESDFVKICQSMVDGNLTADKVTFSHKATVCKYTVPKGYPDAPLKGFSIDISPILSQSNLYLSSVNQVDDTLYATGSRTAAFVGVADTIDAAEKSAEGEISLITGPLFHRNDIGTQQLVQRRIDDMVRIRNS